MDALLSLWLPIVLSAAAVWIISAVVWMALPHHKNDFIGLPDEDRFIEFLRGSAIAPGNYVFPDFRGREAMKSEKAGRCLAEGPIGHLSLWKPPLTMGGKMLGTFVVYLIVSALIGYLASITVPEVAPFSKVFQIVTTAGVLAYSFAMIPNSIWFGSYTRTIIAHVVDGLAYGAVTGLIFASLWPH